MNSPASALPSVGALLELDTVRRLADGHGREVVRDWVRDELGALRAQVRNVGGETARDGLVRSLIERLLNRASEAEAARLDRVINATGVILHTGLGRAPLSAAAAASLAEAAGAGNVEVDLVSGERRYRGYQLQPLWRALTGCEDSLVVNNNAAATLLTLQALCAGREVVISRGQLVEIGGSFRLPEIFELSGAKLREVGTTNRTRLADYERAIGPETAAIMRVHPSNYQIVGFAESPGIGELAALARRHGLIAIDDIGSGSLVDLTGFGLPHEPTFPQSLAGGADVVLGSGDKLLGGPQSGILLGRSALVERIRNHPLARAVRVDKLTLAALSATLSAYLHGEAMREVPTLALLATPVETLRERAEAIRRQIPQADALHITVEPDVAPVGGGSLPTAELPTVVLRLTHSGHAVDEIARRLRLGSVRVVPRIRRDAVVIDFRSVPPADDERIVVALRALAMLTTN